MNSSSEGRPSMMSRCIEVVDSAGNPSAVAIMVDTTLSGRGMPRAVAIEKTSSMMSCAKALVSGRVLQAPKGARVIAPTPLVAAM